MKKLTIYICGPISDLPNWNREAFEAAEKMLLDKGYEVINPHKIPEHVGAEDTSWSGYMRRDIPYLMKADAVCLLPGWRNSKGAFLEFALCQDIGIETFSMNFYKNGDEEITKQTISALRLAHQA